MGDRAKGRQRVGRHPPEAGLETEISAKRRRYTHTAGAIGAHAQGAQPRGHRCCRATRRTPRGFSGVPGVAGDARSGGIGLGLAAKFRRVGFTDQNRTGFAQTGRHRRINIPGLHGVYGAAAAKGRPALGQDQIFDGGWHAVKQAYRCAAMALGLPARLAAPGTLQRRFARHQAKRIEQWIEALNAHQYSLGHLHRRGLCAAIKPYQLLGAALGQV